MSPADDVSLFVRAKRRLNGEPEKVTMSVKHFEPTVQLLRVCDVKP